MTGNTQDPSQTDWEGEGGASASEPKQKTPKDVEIPLPKRESIFAAFKKIVQPVKKRP